MNPDNINPDYLRDESRLSGMCENVIRVSKREEIENALNKTEKITVQGARTGITGAAVPLEGTVLDLSGLSGITGISFENDSFFLEVLPGTNLSDIRAALMTKRFDTADWSRDSLAILKEFGAAGPYFFAPDPTETTATIGGMFATNAGGPSSLHYGRTANHIEAAQIRLVSGELVRVRRGDAVFSKDGIYRFAEKTIPMTVQDSSGGLPLIAASGSDLLDLLAGSEGMLGIAESLTLRLMTQPKRSWSVVFFFSAVKQAAIFADATVEYSASWTNSRLTVLDYLDVHALDFFRLLQKQQPALAAVPEPNKNCCAVMVNLISSDENETEEILLSLMETAAENGGDPDNSWAANTDDQIEKFQRFRHGIPESVNNKIDENRRALPGLTKIAADITMGEKIISDFLPATQENLNKTSIPYALYAHIGNKHLHINLLPETHAQYARCDSILQDLYEAAHASHGKIITENGIGKLKKIWLGKYYTPDQKETMMAIKSYFDPENRLNPGNML